jgi:hypothetical protein
MVEGRDKAGEPRRVGEGTFVEDRAVEGMPLGEEGRAEGDRAVVGMPLEHRCHR